MLASQIIDNGYQDSKNCVGNIPGLESIHSLKGTLKRYLGKDLSEDKKQLQKSFIGMNPNDLPSYEQLNYAAGDVEYLHPLYIKQLKYIEERGLKSIIKLENTLTPVLVKTEFKGSLIDQTRHKENIKNWGLKLKEIEDSLDVLISKLSKNYPQIQGGKFTNTRKREELIQLDMFGGEGYVIKNLNVYNINYSSPKQIEDIFTRIGCNKPVDDSGKVSFGENSIKTYINTNPDSPLCKFLETLLDYREYSKLLSTYGAKLFHVIDKDGRLRTSYGQMFTDTGRLNSASIITDHLGLNLANIPKRKDIKGVFISDPGYSFVDCDQAGQEILIAGDFSKEPLILKSFKEGFDLHSFLASISYSIIFNKKIEIKNNEDSIKIGEFEYKFKDLRQDHKSCLFAKFYGGGAMRVQNVLNKYLVNHQPPEKRFEKADEISKALNNSLTVLTKYLKSTVEFCKKHGYVVANKLGLRRYFDEPEKAYGDIMNFGIQSTGSASIKIAMINIDKWFASKSKELGIKEEELGWISLSVYDQNLCCLNDKYLHLAPEIQEIMGTSLTYFLTDLKGSSDMKINKSWSK